ncbi:MAG: hypothetical protein JNG89_11635 [Planctomycetaceae bacterium]|nr:hypothetical protein [Planctomycetaceae bacterium]
MNTGNLQAARGRMQEAIEQLQIDWNAASQTWVDHNAAQFSEEHLGPVFEEFRTALPAISHLVQVLQAASRELEEESRW